MNKTNRITIGIIILLLILFFIFLGIFTSETIIAIGGLVIINIALRILQNKYPFFGSER